MSKKTEKPAETAETRPPAPPATTETAPETKPPEAAGPVTLVAVATAEYAGAWYGPRCTVTVPAAEAEGLLSAGGWQRA